MRWVPIVIASWFLTLAANGGAQAHKAGLWEVTTKTTLQQAADPDGHFNNQPGGQSTGGTTASLPACYTTDLISKYGMALPPSLRDCELTNIVQKSGTFQADMTCKGTYNGKGSVESTWTDDDHVVGKVHFTSKTRDAQPLMIRWTQDITAAYKGADCGAVRPRVAQAKPAAPPAQ